MTRRLCLAALVGLPACTLRRTESTLRPLDEQTFREMVASHHGEVLLVDFWATWCAPCREELPKLVALYESHQKKRFSFVTISCDEPEQTPAATSFINKQGAPGPHYIKRAKNDDRFINAIDPKWSGALPALFLYDPSGHKVSSFIGETDMNQLKSAIENILG